MTVKHSLLLGLGAVFVIGGTGVLASEFATPTMSSQDTGAYSQLIWNGFTYMIRDRDFNPQEPSSGFFSTWLYNPETQKIQVRARYCVPQLSLTDAPAAVLEQIAITNNGQVLTSIHDSLGAVPASREVIQPGYYRSAAPIFSPFRPWGLWNSLEYSAPVYRPTVSCAAGSTSFDLAPVSESLLNLPITTLGVRLVFSDGETSNWHLGARTVGELKRMIALSKRPIEGR